MTAMELFEALNQLDIKYDVREIFDGIRTIDFMVEEEDIAGHY
jgi:hypothetical protein